MNRRTTNGHANGQANSHLPNDKPALNFDIVIVGAGISGINAAYRIQQTLPSHSYTILEARHDLGGTWSLFKYPGIRSDSDLHTFGFAFNPWKKPNPIATGASIVEYMNETAEKFRIDKRFEFQHNVLAANWSSEEQEWRLEVENDGRKKVYYAKFVILGTGYYDYEEPLKAQIPGLDNFAGTTIHPQFWPEDLDYKGKRIIIIGSGATAVTILPALIDGGAGQATMLQRSPTYIVNLPQKKPGELRLYERVLPQRMALQITRLLFIWVPYLFFLFCRQFPTAARSVIRKGAQHDLPPNFPLDPHFVPHYEPWDQRLCFCPDSDFFKCFGSGRAHIVTRKIKQVVKSGIELDSGERLEADIIVTATGLNLRFGGNIALSVDKKKVNVADHHLWRASMLTDVPNLTLVIGYVNASWTLGSDCTARLFCRLIKFLEKNNYTSARPRIGEEEKKDPRSVFQLKSTYVNKGAGNAPTTGWKDPWLPREHYFFDNWSANWADLRKGMEFERVADKI
ncbi:FAD dependent oxidoreductase [Amniculicola lignicola CBS 123094]|uniref:FAD dependent oxidoreductase n=1 Tax=Amniculicola lignicola CBS 123094 TaxID=1392246 RepID=A0A6A5VW48_9PLEO|nr:FAD dependent oxidoreductase [Amniculicola lignicola CBS 123094]